MQAEPAGRTRLRAPTGPGASLSGGALLSGVLLGAWLLACDGWVKVLARAGCCEDTRVVGDAAAAVWEVPGGCEPLPLVPGVVLSPAERAGATPMNLTIPEEAVDFWGLGLFVIASLVSLAFVVWRKRSSGDALAIGTLWAGVAIHGLPRVVGPGTSFSEIAVQGFGVSIGDVTLAWAGLWLTWRVLASLRS